MDCKYCQDDIGEEEAVAVDIGYMHTDCSQHYEGTWEEIHQEPEGVPNWW